MSNNGWMLMLLPSLLLAATAESTLAKPATRNRAEIPDSYKWDLSRIYPSWEAWEADLKKFESMQDDYVALKGTLANGPQALLKAEKMGDDISLLAQRLGRYASLSRDVDSRDNAVTARLQKLQAALVKFGAASSWYNPELLKVPEATALKWVDETPALRPSRFSISELYRLEGHTLPEDEEKLLSLAGSLNGVPSSIYREVATSDIKYPDFVLANGDSVTLSPGTYQTVVSTNRNQADRRGAFLAYAGMWKERRNSIAAIYNGVLQRDWFMAQARRYPTTVDAALDRNHVPPEVLYNLISTVKAGMEPVRRYHRLRKAFLHLDSYDLYDASIPLVDFDRTYPYDQVKDMVIASTAPLGADYQAKLKQRFDGRWVDVYENDGKRSGAYSSGVYGVGPYMLLNYSDNLKDVFTLAHEMGHSVHTVLAYETQPYQTAYYTIFVAEVASTLNEALLMEYMLGRTSDPKERATLLQNQIDGILGTFIAQVIFADFELEAHRLVENGQPVTADALSKLYLDLMHTYYGDALEADPNYGLTWARISHFYDSPYYVYQYATCFASSAQLVKPILHGTPAEKAAGVERHLTLLRSGGNDHPMEQLKKAGVDLASPEPIRAVLAQLEDLVSRLEVELMKM